MSLRSTHRLAGLLMVGALLGKILGFVREVTLAHALGASILADSYRGAITAVMLPLVFVQNECVPAVLVPQHQQWQRDGRAARALASLALSLGLLTLALTVTIEFGLKAWVDAIVGGFSADGQTLTENFVRIMALSMPASVVLNVLASAEIAMGRARLTSIRSSLLNVSVIIGITIYMLTGYTLALPWSFMLSFNVLVVWGTWQLRREGALDPSGLTWAAIRGDLMDFFRRLRPLLIQPVSEQAFWWSERSLASRLVVGSVASIDYARTLTETAILIISQPLGLSVLAKGPPKDVPGAVDKISRPMLALAVPSSVFAVFFADPVVRLVFGRGAFDDHAVHLSGSAMSGISVGLWAATLGWVLLRLLNGAGRNGHAALVLTAAYMANLAWNIASSPWQPNGNGTLLLGLGEAVRGLVLLFGCTFALGCLPVLLRLLLLSSPAALLMGVLALVIQAKVVGWQMQLALGLLACGASIVLAGALLLRGETRDFVLRVGRSLGTNGGVKGT